MLIIGSNNYLNNLTLIQITLILTLDHLEGVGIPDDQGTDFHTDDELAVLSGLRVSDH